MGNKVILKVNNLHKSFITSGVEHKVINNLNLDIYDRDFTVIMGSSGSGKSTLLYALSGMDKPTSGKILFEDKEISKLSDNHLAHFRRNRCGFVFQQIHLLDNMNVLDNILASSYLSTKNRSDAVLKAKQLLKQVGLTEQIWKKFPSQISGGEAQRVGIVRAIINHPTIVFADEPTGALNYASGQNVLDILTKVNADGQSIVMVTHDIKSALRGNRIIYIRDGLCVGEFSLTPYAAEKSNTADNKRSNQLRDFLTDMGW